MLRSFLRTLQSGAVAPQLRRFVAVGTVAATFEMGILWAFVAASGLPYLASALIAIEASIVLSYVLNDAWTFPQSREAGRAAYIGGLVRTNVVRGTAIPLQLSILYALVEWVTVPVLPANGVAILLSGCYRYVLDARWTWG